MPWRHPPLAAPFPASGGKALLAAVGAAAVAALLAWLGPPGGDLAAHEYQRSLFLAHGFTLWDNYWYAGRYVFVGYSVLYYPLAALLGIRVLAVLTVALAAGVFTQVLELEWGTESRWARRSFALVWPGVVVTGEFPFALGVALGLLGLLALQTGRRWAAGVLILLVLAASPVAFVLLVVVLAGIAAGRRVPLRAVAGAALAVAVGIAAELVLLRLFPAGGTLGFPAGEMAEAGAFCLGLLALAWRVERAAILRGVAAVYLLAVLATYAIPSGLGHDVTRLRLLALPVALLVAGVRRWRPFPLVLAAVALAGAWNVAPLAAQWVQSDADRSSSASTWTAPVAYLRTHLRLGYRVEAVDTSQHWPALYLARAGLPLARGWFRQDDFPFNALLYRQRLTAGEYRAWLHELGIAYVVLTDAPADYTSRREAELVRSGRAGLRRVFATRHVTIYAVPGSRSIVFGLGRPRVTAFGQASFAVRLPRAGDYGIAVRWSRWWHASTGRLFRLPDGLMGVRTTGAASVRISFRFP